MPKDTILISGMAKGIDTLAHEAAIKHKIRTIAVLGSGIDFVIQVKISIFTKNKKRLFIN